MHYCIIIVESFKGVSSIVGPHYNKKKINADILSIQEGLLSDATTPIPISSWVYDPESVGKTIITFSYTYKDIYNFTLLNLKITGI